MACYSPHRVHRGDDRPDGKVQILWRGNNVGHRRVQLPCGSCVGCKLERSRQWAMRSMCESRMHERNCFVTLTFDDANLPKNRSLDVRHLQLFFKSLRQELGVPVRYLACGEYGSRTFRPHYHALLFGVDFTDRVPLTVRNGNRLYTSATLQKVWPHGYSSVGDFSVKAAAYVSRYVLKKVPKRNEGERYVNRLTGEVLKSEFIVMSRRPGIGATWFDRFRSDVYPSDEMVVEGRPMKPPRFFDKQLEKVDPQLLDSIKAVRGDNLKSWEENSIARLLVKEECKAAQLRQLSREMEDGKL